MRKVEVRIFENGKVLDSSVACSWTAFLNGHWTKDRPTRPGKYMIANRAGRIVGEVFVFFDAVTEELVMRIRDGALCKIKEFDDTNVFWWTSPMPIFMPIPVPRDVSNLPNQEEALGSQEEWVARKKLRGIRDSGKLYDSDNVAYLPGAGIADSSVN